MTGSEVVSEQRCIIIKNVALTDMRVLTHVASDSASAAVHTTSPLWLLILVTVNVTIAIVIAISTVAVTVSIANSDT